MASPVHPVALLVFPVAALAATRRKWALMFVVASVPLFAVVPLEAISHRFRIPEIAVLTLGVNQLYRWTKTGTVEFPDARPLYWLGLFLVVACVSVIALVLFTPDVITHPYNLGLDGFRLRELQVRPGNVTQLLLRTFAVGAVVVLVENLTESDIYLAGRGIVFGALFTGLLGLLYQLSVLVGSPAVPLLFKEVANQDLYFRFLGRGGYGLLQQMYTLAGEPAITAQFLLFALGVTMGVSLIGVDTPILTYREAWVSSIALLGMLVLTKATTAFGGILVLGVVLTGVSLFVKSTDPAAKWRAIATGIVGVVTSLALLLVLGIDVVGMFLKQLEELQFQGGSGDIRLRYFWLSADVFATRPSIGIGPGSYYSTSLAGTLLGEVGLLGALSFLLANVTAHFECLSVREGDGRRGVAVGLFVGGTTLLFTSLVAKSITTLLTPWFWFSLALPIAFVWRTGGGQRDRTEEGEGIA